ncbi:MAG: hypothetical protein KME31_13380 [Tolypothrix carrinoi HA7290-LM1]|jgi:hypothetical protein|nr:hypothetical protein [Tolypothrix carrinoi HA7290-LM1]
MYQIVMRITTLSSALVLAIASLIGGKISSVTAQKNIPVCTAPTAGEYLLLVISPTQDNQTQLRRTLPTELKTTTCRYLNDTVTRIGGFNKIDDANRWARYVNSIVGLSAIITTRPTTTTTTTTTNVQQPRSQTASYNPQSLGMGYAVLVDYFNRPELATQLQQIVEGDIGFVSYGQRPYLLAVYTTNQKEAYNTLQKLNERGFSTYLVDSRKVLLLRSVVRL